MDLALLLIIVSVANTYNSDYVSGQKTADSSEENPAVKYAARDDFISIVRGLTMRKAKITTDFITPYCKVNITSLKSNMTVDEFIVLEIFNSLAIKDFTFTNFLLDLVSEKYVSNNKTPIVSNWLKSSLVFPFEIVYTVIENVANSDKTGITIPSRISEEFLTFANASEVFLEACSKGDVEIAKWTLGSGAELDLLSCIESAWENNHIAVVKLLIANDALSVSLKGKSIITATNANNETLLHFLAKTSDPFTLSSLLGAGADPNTLDGRGHSPLYEAVTNDDLFSVKMLADYGADVNTKISNGDTPLHAAVSNGNIDMVKELVDLGSTLDIRNDIGIRAIQKGEALMIDGIIKHLLKRNVSIPSEIDSEQVVVPWTVLTLKDNNHMPENGKETVINYSDIVKFLLQRREKTHLSDSLRTKLLALLNDVGSPSISEVANDLEAVPSQIDDVSWIGLSLIDAVKKGNIDIVKTMLSEGASVNRTDTSGSTALHEAARRGDTDVMRLLIVEGADVSAKDKIGWTALHKAAYEGKEAAVELLLDNGVDVNAKDVNDDTPLHEAAIKGNMPAARLLLDRGADVNATDSDGWTPLHAAAQKGHIKLLNFLITRGADVNAKNSDDRTPLFLASQKGEDVIVKILLASGGDIQATDIFERTALHAAASEGHSDVINTLIYKGIDSTMQDESGYTALHDAVTTGQKVAVEALLSAGAKIEAKNRKGWTALHEAAWKGRSKLIETLIKKGADVNSKTTAGETALQLAVRGDNYLIADVLLQNGAVVDTKDRNGLTALHEAAKHNNMLIANLLLLDGIDVNVKDNEGRTPLFEAVISGHPGIIAMLIERGADVKITDKNGMKHIDLAKDSNIKSLLT